MKANSRTVRFALSLLCILSSFSHLAGEAVDGAPPPPILAELTVNGISRGTVSFELNANGSPQFTAKTIKFMLGGTARGETVDELIKGGRLVTAEDLAAAGIRCVFDSASLHLMIDVAPERMESAAIDFAPKRTPVSGMTNAIKPQPFSVITGIGASVNPRRDEDTFGSSSTIPVDLTLSPAINILGLVFEGSSTMTWVDAQYSSRVNTARVVLDFPSLGARLTGGTVENRPVAFQGKSYLIGASFNKESGFPGSRDRGRQDSADIVLERRASVAVAVNGTTVRNATLESGTYHLSDLPLSSGLNDVTVTIAEDGLPPRVVQFGVPFDPSLLDPGETDFSTALGYDRQSLSRPFGSAYFYVGLAHALEIGIDAQGEWGNYLGGISVLWASPIGFIGLGSDVDMRNPETSQAKATWAAKASWRFSSPSNRYIPFLGLAAVYRSAHFAPPEETGFAQSVSADPSWLLSGQIGQTIPAGMGSVALYGDSTVTRGTMTNSVVQAGYFLTLGKRVSLSVSGGSEWHAGEGTSPRASFVAVITPEHGPIVQYRNDPVAKKDSVDVSMMLDRAGMASIGAHYSDIMWMAEGDRSAGMTGRAGADIGELSSSFQYDSYADTGAKTYMGNLSASTSVAFGGGRLLIGNPRSDSFAILVPDKSLSGMRVRLTSAEGPLTESKAGKAVPVSGLSLYRPFAGAIDIPGSGPDKNASPSFVEFTPEYKSVTLIRVSLDSPIYARGLAVDAAGLPLAGQWGDLLGTDGAALPDKGTFTDENGMFECYGLVPGDYSIAWGDGTTSRFSIPAIAHDGIVQLGTVSAIRQAADKGDKK